MPANGIAAWDAGEGRGGGVPVDGTRETRAGSGAPRRLLSLYAAASTCDRSRRDAPDPCEPSRTTRSSKLDMAPRRLASAARRGARLRGASTQRHGWARLHGRRGRTRSPAASEAMAFCQLAGARLGARAAGEGGRGRAGVGGKRPRHVRWAPPRSSPGELGGRREAARARRRGRSLAAGARLAAAAFWKVRGLVLLACHAPADDDGLAARSGGLRALSGASSRRAAEGTRERKVRRGGGVSLAVRRVVAGVRDPSRRQQRAFFRAFLRFCRAAVELLHAADARWLARAILPAQSRYVPPTRRVGGGCQSV